MLHPDEKNQLSGWKAFFFSQHGVDRSTIRPTVQLVKDFFKNGLSCSENVGRIYCCESYSFSAFALCEKWSFAVLFRLPHSHWFGVLLLSLWGLEVWWWVCSGGFLFFHFLSLSWSLPLRSLIFFYPRIVQTKVTMSVKSRQNCLISNCNLITTFRTVM